MKQSNYSKPNYFQKGHIPHNQTNIVGNTYHFLTVIAELGNRKILCKCVCGKEIEAYKTNVTSGKSKSCNCGGRGMAKHRTVRAWSLMKYRCLTNTSPDYAEYGGRGVTIDTAWLDFFNFFRDMGDCPDGFTLDRINVNGAYCKDNCRWADAVTQMNNRRTNHYIEVDGKKTTLTLLARKAGLVPSTLARRLEKGMSVDKAISTPINTACYSKALKEKHGVS